MIYNYKVFTKDLETFEGSLEAEDLAVARSRLRSQGYSIISLEEDINKNFSLTLDHEFSSRELSIIFQQMALFLRAGLDIIYIIELLAHGSKGWRKKSFDEIKLYLEQGSNLSEAIQYTRVFPPLVPSLFRAGEASGNLELVLDELAIQYDREHKLKRKILNILTYPVVLFFTSLAVIYIILKFILPIFTEVFVNAGSELPWFTEILISMGIHFDRYGFIYIVLFCIACLVLFLLYKFTNYRLAIDKWLYKAPGISFFYRHRFWLFFLQSMSVQFITSVPLIDILDNCKGITKNKFLHRQIERAIEHIKKGSSLSEALRETELLPWEVIRLIYAGEESSSLSETLTIAIKYLEKNFEERSTKLIVFIEPTLIIIMSIFVGFIVFSIAIPMFDLINQI